ncbi:MAG: sigma-70 family RNA polymerase sigma factor [Bryobacteraceae bacterium]|nr:sigma-70 family RNA polymerase sigma factor [Bryobacteraceae bacterium]
MIFREVDDLDLVRGARKGDVQMYNRLVSRWEKRVFNYLLRIVGSPDDAQDVSQEAFLKAYQSLARLDDPARFGPWLYRIAHNEAISLIRRRRPAEDVDMAAMAAPRSLAGVELSLAVETALGRLTPEQREAVLLKVYEGFKFDEIAGILGCPASTVKSRVYTGLEQLKLMLAPHTGAGRAGKEARS